MLIRQDGTTIGTIGGGILEVQVEQSAREVLRHHRTISQSIWFNGKDDTTMEPIYGGQVEVLLEWMDVTQPNTINLLMNLKTATTDNHKSWLITSLSHKESTCHHVFVQKNGRLTGDLPDGFLPETVTRARRPTRTTLAQEEYFIDPLENGGTVYIFGAGHISPILAQFTKTLGFWTVILDDRPSFVNPEKFPAADQLIVLNNFSEALSRIEVNQDSFLVIVTRDPALDRTVLAQALRSPAGYIGMMGSYRKCGAILDELCQLGFSGEDIRRVHAPIGLPIDAETAEEISVSIISELVQARAKKRK